MANVLTSASRSTVSIFDTVGQTASVLARSVDWVDTKVSVWHQAAKLDAAHRITTLEQEAKIRAAQKHAEFLTDHFERYNSDAQFAALYDEAMKLFA